MGISENNLYAVHEGNDADFPHLFKDVTHLFRSLNKVFMLIKIYDENSTVVDTEISTFYNMLQSLLEKTAAIPIQIGKSEILFAGKKLPIMNNLIKEFTFLLFNEGIRILTFSRSITKEELYRFFNLFHLVKNGRLEEIDFVRHVWEAGCDNISISLVEEFYCSDEIEPYQPSHFMSEIVANSPTSTWNTTYRSHKTSHWTDTSALSADDIKHFQQTIQERDQFIIFRRLIDYSAYYIQKNTNAAETHKLINNISFLWQNYIYTGDLDKAYYILKTIFHTGNSIKNSNTEMYKTIKISVAQLNDDTFLEKYLSMATDLPPKDFKYYAEIIAYISLVNIEKVLKHVSNIINKDLRLLCLKKTAHRFKNVDKLSSLINSDDWMMTRNVLILLEHVKDMKILPIIKSLISHPVQQVRIEALNVLHQYPVDAVLPILEKAIYSPHKDVRHAALHMVLQLPDKNAMPLLKRVLQRINKRTVDPEELRTYAKLIIDTESAEFLQVCRSFSKDFDKIFNEISRLRSSTSEY